MMIILSNKKFLSLFAAMVAACSLTAAVDARMVGGSHLRREETRGRNLKRKKAAPHKTSKGGSTPFVQTITTAVTNTFSPPLITNAVDTSSWGVRCPQQENTLNSCVLTSGGSNDDMFQCQLCIKGQANLKTVTRLGLNSCSNPKIGGYCQECYDEVQKLFECGSGKLLGGGGPSIGADETTGVIAEPNSSGGGESPPAPVNTMELYAPQTRCPTTNPNLALRATRLDPNTSSASTPAA
jgi:hypothetical protein